MQDDIAKLAGILVATVALLKQELGIPVYHGICGVTSGNSNKTPSQ